MEFWNIFMVILFGIKNNPYSHFFQLFVFLGIRFEIHLYWKAIIWYLSTTIQRKDNYASLYGGHKLYFNSADVYWGLFSEFYFSLIRINLNSIGQLYYDENQWKLCYMTVLQIQKKSVEALKPPYVSSKCSHAGSDDVFNKAGEKDWWYLRSPWPRWQDLTKFCAIPPPLWIVGIVNHHLVRK